MPVTINGNGSITGLSVGGLGDGGIVDTGSLANGAVTNVKHGTGSIIQVVATNITATSTVAYGAAALSATTPVTVNITSTILNSKFLISGMIHGEAERENYEVGFVTRRTIGGSGASINVGTGSGSRAVVTRIMGGSSGDTDHATTSDATIFAPYLDSPSQAAGTTITYAFHPYGIVHSGTFYFGRTRNDGNNSYDERTPNHITVMEVAP